MTRPQLRLRGFIVLVAAAAAQFAGFGPVLRGMSVLIAAVVLFMQVRVWPVLRRED